MARCDRGAATAWFDCEAMHSSDAWAVTYPQPGRLYPPCIPTRTTGPCGERLAKHIPDEFRLR